MRQVLLLCVLALCACAPRGQLTTLPQDTPQAPGASLHEILVATARNRVSDGQVYGSERSERTNYARFTVSVPPAHETGQIEWPRGTVDPQAHFYVRSGALLEGQGAFADDLARRLAQTPQARGAVTLFVHGFNTNFAEGLYRMAQARHDFSEADVPVLFSWASEATPVGYLYDRDSTLTARDNLAEVIELLSRSDARQITLAAHSMGSFLLMETLRGLALSSDRAVLDRIGGVVLMSPDIDVDLFEAQLRAFDRLPQPFVVITSRNDRALGVADTLAGDQGRLGNTEQAERLRALGITVLDVTALSEPGSLNHLTAITSPEFIRIARELGEVGQSLDADIARPDWAAGLTGMLPELQ